MGTVIAGVGRASSARATSPRATRLVALLAVAVVGAAFLAGPRLALAADGPTFGTPTASSQFLTAITLTEPVTLPSDVLRIDVLVQTEGSDRTFVDTIGVPSSGQQTLSYTFPTPSGALIANTLVQLSFRVALDDGSSFPGPVASVRYEDTRFEWQTLTGPLVTVHWTSGGAAFGQKALQIAQSAIQTSSQFLGVTVTSPIDFYVYADQQAFYDVLGPATRENVGGEAFPEIRTLFANITTSELDDPWVGIVIPHELTHVVFATATQNPYHDPPHWLNEGVAVYLSQGYDSTSKAAVSQAVGDGTLMPLDALTGQFPTSGDRFNLAYDEAVSAVDFMVRHYGQAALVKVLHTYAQGVSDDTAFQAGLGVGLAGFEAAWLADLGAPAPSPFGPRPAPAGPVPSGWSGGAPVVGIPAPTGSTSGGGSGASQGGGTDDLGQAALLAGVVLLFLLVGLGGAALVLRERRPPPPPPPAPW